MPSFSGPYGNKLPQLSSAVPSFPTLSSQTFPSYSNLLPTITSPGVHIHAQLFFLFSFSFFEARPSRSAHFNKKSVGGFQCLTSICHPPAKSKVRDGGQNQISSQGVLAEYQPRPMHSPPPLRRASLPLFQTNYNPANPAPPLHNTLAHTPPLFLDALEGGSSLHHRDSLQSLQTDTRSAPLLARQ